MTIERGAALALLWLATVATAADDKPGGKRICVPSEDGRSWVCGTPDAPPPERGLPAVRDDAPSPEPPPFLAAPGGVQSSTPAVDLSAPPPERPLPDRFEGTGREVPTTAEAAAVAPVEEAEPAAPEPLVEETPAVAAEPAAPEAEPAVDVVGADAAEVGTPRLLAAPREDPGFPSAPEPTPAPAGPEPAPAEPEPAPEPEAEPAAADPVAVEPAVAEPEPTEPEATAAEPAAPLAAEPVAEPQATEPVAEPEATETVAAETAATAPAAPEPAPAPVQALATPPGNTAAFLAQPATHYTLQVARAASQSGFGAWLATLGLRGEEAWAVPLSGGGTTSWMLLWGTFPDLESARAAAAQLAPRVAAWPRRVAPIQDELRAAGTR